MICSSIYILVLSTGKDMIFGCHNVRFGGVCMVFRSMNSCSWCPSAWGIWFTIFRDRWLFPNLGYICLNWINATLIVTAYDRAYLWYIPSGKHSNNRRIHQFIASEDGNNLNHCLLGIMHVEISERHVFVAGQIYLRIFSRATDKNILNFSSSVPEGTRALEAHPNDLTLPNFWLNIDQIRDTGTV